jgi:hypothetical protein
MKILGLLISIFALQGCTLVSGAVGATLGLSEEAQNELVNNGMRTDIDFIASLLKKGTRHGSPKPSSCEELKGKKKAECRDVAKRVNTSIEKHTK